MRPARIAFACRAAARVFHPADFRRVVAPMTQMYCGVPFGAATKSPFALNFSSACGTPMFGFSDIKNVEECEDIMNAESDAESLMEVSTSEKSCGEVFIMLHDSILPCGLELL